MRSRTRSVISRGWHEIVGFGGEAVSTYIVSDEFASVLSNVAASITQAPLVTVVLITRRIRSEPVSGAIVTVRSPLARRTRTIDSVRSSRRSDAGLMAYPISRSRARMRSMSG